MSQFCSRPFIVLSDAGLLEEEREVGLGWLIMERDSKTLLGMGSVWERSPEAEAADITAAEMNAAEWAAHHVKMLRKKTPLSFGKEPDQNSRTSIRKLVMKPLSQAWIESSLQKSRKVQRHQE